MSASPLTKRRFRAAIVGLCGLLIALALPAAAFANALSPEDGSGSPNAVDIHTLYTIVAILGAIVFFGVEGLLIYTLIKFRHRRGGTPPAQIRGNTPLEIGWTLGAAGLLVIITVVTFIFLPGIKNPAGSKPNGYVAEAGEVSGSHNTPSNPDLQFASLNQAPPPGPPNKHLEIHVNGQQYIWRFDYPGQQQVFSYHDMIVPTGTTVVLNITASDVDHSWWIPALGGKADAIPGHVNHTWFRIDKPGSWEGNCAEFCGENHADMTARVIAVPPDQFKAWLARKASEIKQSQALLSLARKTRGGGTP